MKLLYQGRDIYPEISINNCVHDMRSCGQSDSLIVRFNDVRRLWDTWRPSPGDTVAVQEKTADSGIMFMKSSTPMNAMYTIQALSCPDKGFEINNRSWENATLFQIINDIAGNIGLSVETYGIENHEYNYIKQENQSDYSFLNERLIFEGCSFLVYDKKLVAYSESSMENQASVKTIETNSDTNFGFTDNSHLAYKSISIECGIYSGSFQTDNGSEKAMKINRIPSHVGSGPEANRFAKGILRSKNKYSHTGYIMQEFMPDIAAGSVIDLLAYGANSWSGKAFVYAVRHDYVNHKTKLFIRKPLEGY